MQDLTMSEVLRDPLIRQMLRADKISLGSFAVLLEDAARKRGRRLSAAGSEVSLAGPSNEQGNLLQ